MQKIMNSKVLPFEIKRYTDQANKETANDCLMILKELRYKPGINKYKRKAKPEFRHSLRKNKNAIEFVAIENRKKIDADDKPTVAAPAIR
jgi:hypothetical protein